MKKLLLFLTLIIFALFAGCGLSKKECIEVYKKVFELEKTKGSGEALKYLEENIPKANQDYVYYSVWGRVLRDSDPNLMSGFAAEYFLESYAKNKKVFMTNYLLGQTFAILEKYSDAYFYFKNAESLAAKKRNKERNLREPYLELANVCIHLGKFEEALAYNEKVPQQNSEDQERWKIMQRGIILSELEDKAKLDEYYAKTKEVSTPPFANGGIDPFIERLYAAQKAALGEYEQAICVYKNLISTKEFEKSSILYSELASAYLLKKDFENAETALGKAYELNNNNKTCLKNYALFYYFAKDDFENAARYATKALNVNFYEPDYIEIKTKADLLAYFNTEGFLVYRNFINENEKK